MKIVIDIPKSIYETIEKDQFITRFQLAVLQSQIRKGTPLPKGHGRLIDAREYENSIRKHYFDNSTVIRCTEIALDNAPTIIEADTESEDKA